MVVEVRIGQGGFEVSSPSRGIGQVTTFCGLCQEHDSSIFQPIEASEACPENAEHLFLLAYRAVLEQYDNQRCHLLAAEELLANEGSVRLHRNGRSDYVETQRRCEQYIRRLMGLFHRLHCQKTWGQTLHLEARLLGPPNRLAAATWTLPHYDLGGKRIRHDPSETAKAAARNGLGLVLLPSESGQLMVLCRHKRAVRGIKAIANRLLNLAIGDLELPLSRFLLTYCGTLVFLPAHWEAFGAARQQAMERFCRATMRDASAPFPGAAANIFAAKRGC